MERNSTPKSIRTERIAAGSPYARPSKAVKPKSSLSNIAPMASLRSLYSYVTSSFTRQPSLLPSNNDDLADDDQKSESGSEDGWNGQPPATMNGDEDVFDAASAAGRRGDDFDARAAEWRARGEKPGGRREMARRGLLTSTSTPKLASQGSSQIAPKPQRTSFSPEPVAPTVGASTSNPRKRPLSPEFATASLRLPLPSTSQPPVPASPSAEALKAFLAARQERSMTVQELRTFETLVDSIKSESSEVGWSAASSLSPSRQLRRLEASAGLDFLTSTPRKQRDETEWSFTSGTSSPLFKVGAEPPAASPSPAKNARKTVYLGPGMSPRRMLRKPQLEVTLESPKKKAKADEPLEDGSRTLSQDSTSQSNASQSSALSTPSASGLSGNDKTRVNSLRTFAPPVSSPLKASFTSTTPGPAASSSKPDPVSVGKQRAANIMKELIETELGTGVLSPSKDVSNFIVNPYDTTSIRASRLSTGASTPSTPVSGSRSSPLGHHSPSTRSPGRPTIRANTDTTPKRGAAARLAATKSTHKLTTLERLSGRGPWSGSVASSSSGKGKASESDMESGEENEGEEVDELFGTPEPETPGPVVAGASATSFDHEGASLPEPITGFAAPQLTSSTYSPVKSMSNLTRSTEIYESPVQKAALASAGASAEPPALFNPTPVSLRAPEVDEPMFSVESSKQAAVASEASSSRPNPSAVFLSAKDAALAVAKPALPYYTFNVPSHDQLPSSVPTYKGSDRMPQPPKYRRRCAPSTSLREAVLLKVHPMTYKFYLEKGKCPSMAIMRKLAAKREAFKAASRKRRDDASNGVRVDGPSHAPSPLEGIKAVVDDTSSTPTETLKSSALPAPPSGGFSFGSASASGPSKPPAVPSGGFSFGGQALSSSSSPKPPAPPAGGFSFGAPSNPTNGHKPPAPPSGGFSFGSASAASTASATNGIKAPAPPSGGFSFGNASSSSSSGGSGSGFTPALPAPPAGGFSFGGPAPTLTPLTNPKAAGGAQWTCTTCMLQNPDSAKDKCQICEADRP